MRVAVIGAGWAGLTCAYLLHHARERGGRRFRVTVIERREHLGGNAWDERQANGEILPGYGAHIFHTRNERVWQFVNHLAGFESYRHRVSVRWHDRHLPYPITTNAVAEIYERDLTDESAAALLAAEGKPWRERAHENFETASLAKMGRRLYEIYVAPYTRKMWGREPHTLAARLAARVPVRLGGDGDLFEDPYQGMPGGSGYGTLFQRMADGLNVIYADYREVRLERFEHIVVTSPLDEWYECDLGRLEYRGMTFGEKVVACRKFVLPTGTVNTNDSADLLRVEEPKRYYAAARDADTSTLVFNYAGGDGQFYPVPDARNDALAARYRERGGSECGVTFAGRLGTYRYLNMDQAILQGMQAAERLMA